MRSTTSSIGPGIGANPSAASQRSGLGMRESVAAMRTARRVRLKNRRTGRTFRVYERVESLAESFTLAPDVLL